MKNLKNISFLVLFLTGAGMNAQTVFGEWKTINEDTGKANSIIEIYKDGEEVHGKVVRIIKEESRNDLCVNCEGDLKGKRIEGLELMRDLTKSGNEYVGGLITDPKSGKTYKCKIWVDPENPDRLKVRGYIAFLYRTETWHRVK